MEERMKIGVENVASACRGCLCDCRNGTCFDIHSFLIAPNCSISQILAKFVSIPMNSDDRLPKQLCPECLRDVYICYNFMNKCQKSEQTLLDVLDDKSISIKIDNIESLAGSFEREEEEEVVHIDYSEILNNATKDETNKNITEVGSNEAKSSSTSESEVIEILSDVEMDCAEKTAGPSNESFSRQERDVLQWMMYCKQCETQFTTFAEYSNHKKIKNLNVPQSCPSCKKQFNNHCHFRGHTLKHQQIKRFRCPACSAVFSKNSALKEHLLTHNGEHPFICPFCKNDFVQAINLKQHIYASIRKPPYNCTFCNKVFQQSCALRKHCGDRHFKRLETLSERFDDDVTETDVPNGSRFHSCPFCKHAFLQSSALKKHLKRSTIKAPYVCVHCAKVFQQLCVLRKHRCNYKPPEAPPQQVKKTVAVATEVPKTTPVQNDECPFCRCKFSKRPDLTKHLDSNVGEFSCDVCGEVFEMQCRLNKHRSEAHSGPQICPFCKKGFTEGVDLRRHLDANADEAPYNCGLCPEMFQQPCLLRKHQYEDHGISTSNRQT